MGTDRKLLAKGIQYLTGSLPVIIIGIYLISFSFVNKIYTLTGLGIIVTGFAMYLIFKGIKTIMNSLFNKN
jgi:hypothetical protein